MRTFIKVFLLAFYLTQPVFAERAFVFALLNLDQATSKVIQQISGKVLGARTTSYEGKEIHIIKILTEDGRIQYIKVDAETGRIFK